MQIGRTILPKFDHPASNTCQRHLMRFDTCGLCRDVTPPRAWKRRISAEGNSLYSISAAMAFLDLYPREYSGDARFETASTSPAASACATSGPWPPITPD